MGGYELGFLVANVHHLVSDSISRLSPSLLSFFVATFRVFRTQYHMEVVAYYREVPSHFSYIFQLLIHHSIKST